MMSLSFSLVAVSTLNMAALLFRSEKAFASRTSSVSFRAFSSANRARSA